MSVKFLHRGHTTTAVLLVVLNIYLFVWLSGCTTVPAKPVIDAAPDQFSLTGTDVTPSQWWLIFSDPALNKMIDEALEHNYDILAAWDRLDQAAALYGISKSNLWPKVQTELGASNLEVLGEEERGDGSFGSESMSSLFYNEGLTWSLSFGASYEIDLWGRVRASKRAAYSDFLMTRENVSSMAMTISSTIALTWYQYCEADLQLQLLGEQIETNKAFLELLELRFNKGFISAADVLQQKQQLSATESEVPLVKSRKAVLKNQLAVLLGKAPHDFRPPVADSQKTELPTIPAFPHTGIPAETLLQRPDIRAAGFQLEAANYRVAEAVASQFPRLSIVASASDEDEKFGSLFKNWFATLAANLTAPIFDAGQLRRNVTRSRAAAHEDLNNFRNTTLRALQEIEDAIIREARHAEFLENLDQQLALAHRTLQATQKRFYNGSTDYLPVLTALQTLQRLERQKIESKGTLLSYRIALYRALGGSWDVPRPSSAQSS